MTQVSTCTREQVQSALNQADAVRNNARIDRCIASATRLVEGRTNHRWYPVTATRYPNVRWITGDVLWLDHIDFEICTATASLTIDGVSYVQGTDFYLDGGDGDGWYNSLRLMPDSASVAWPSTARSVALTAGFGANVGTRPGGTLAAAVSTTSTSSIIISNPAAVGVGDLVTVGTERMIVIEKVTSASGATLAGDLTANFAETAVPVSDGTLFNAGEYVWIGTERMLVETITGNSLVARRAQDGTISTHSSGAPVYSYRTAVVTRGATGTTAATHAQNDQVLVNDPPALVQESTLAVAITQLEQGKAGWSKVVGSGDNQREATGRALGDILSDLDRAYARTHFGATR